MDEEDEEKTAFYTDQGTYCYTKMPFGIKNARATYQRVVDSAFQTQLGRNLEAYVDDIVIKSKTERDMIMDIAETFHNLRKINMKLNPKKYSFGVAEGKFLGYMGTSEGIRANPKKTKAVSYMQSPKTLREMQSLIGKLAVLNLNGVLMAERARRQAPIRYVSRILHKAERNYAPLEKLILCLLHLSRRLRWYFKAHPIKVITHQPIKQVLNKPKASGKLAKYAVELGAYNIVYVPRNAIKGQMLADFINEVPVGTALPEICTLTNGESKEAWTLYTDGASSLKGVGAGLVLIDPSGTEYTYAIRLTFTSTNNKAEYEALLARLKIAYNMKAKEQVALFKKFSTENIPQNLNQKADVLSKLASVAFNHLTKEILVEVLNKKSVDTEEVAAIVEEEEDNWMTPIIKCLQEGVWPTDENEARSLQMKITQYVVEKGVLFKKSYLSPMLRCVGPLQANYIIREVHDGACGMHAGGS
ncbi:reverse transcriptase domain-containing protein [Tanacetum coccineum]